MSVIKMTDLDLAGKRVLIRSDLNVPVKDGKVTSDARIRASPADYRSCAEARRPRDGNLPRVVLPKASTTKNSPCCLWSTT